MVKCKGNRINGRRCKANALLGSDYCQWHQPNLESADDGHECVACLEKVELPLSCGHWAHLECVKKHADSMQDIRAQDGYPPLKTGICPFCRAEIPEVVPKPPPEQPAQRQVNYNLSNAQAFRAYTSWRTEQTDGQARAPLSFYLWVEMTEGEPDRDPEDLILGANLFADMILSGNLVPRAPEPDDRFSRRLNAAWH